MLLVTNLTNTNRCKKPEKWLKPWHMGTHLRVLSESYPMNTNMTWFRCFSKTFASLCFGWSSLSIGRVNINICGVPLLWLKTHTYLEHTVGILLQIWIVFLYLFYEEVFFWWIFTFHVESTYGKRIFESTLCINLRIKHQNSLNIWWWVLVWILESSWVLPNTYNSWALYKN